MLLLLPSSSSMLIFHASSSIVLPRRKASCSWSRRATNLRTTPWTRPSGTASPARCGRDRPSSKSASGRPTSWTNSLRWSRRSSGASILRSSMTAFDQYARQHRRRSREKVGRRASSSTAAKKKKLDQEVLATAVSTLDSIFVKILRERERGPD